MSDFREVVAQCLEEVAAAGRDAGAAAPAWARFGVARLHLYGARSEPGDLDEAVVALRTAVADAPGHPDRPLWAVKLAEAYELRCARDGDVDDLRRAADAAGQAVIGDGDIAAEAAGYRAELAFARYEALAGTGRPDQVAVALDTSVGLADAACRALGAQSAAGRGDNGHHRFALQLSIETRRARYVRLSRAEDLDLMITAAERLAADPPPGPRADLRAQVGELLFHRATQPTRRAGDVARTITVLREALAEAPRPGPDASWVPAARYRLAMCLHRRAQEDDDAAVLADAVAQARRVADVPGWCDQLGPTELAHLGRVLHDGYAATADRATADRATLDAAVRLLTTAWDRSPAGDAVDRWQTGWELGLAEWSRYEADGRPETLHRVWALVQEVRSLVPADSDEGRYLTMFTVYVWCERVRIDPDATRDEQPPMTAAETVAFHERVRTDPAQRMRAGPDAGTPWRLRQLQDPDRLRVRADHLIAQWRALPEGSVERCQFGGRLAGMQMALAVAGRNSLEWPEIVAMLREALSVADPDAPYRTATMTALATALSMQAMHHDQSAVGESVEILEQIADDETIDPALRAEINLFLGMAVGLRHEMRGAEADAATAEKRLERLFDDPNLVGRQQLLLRAQHAALVCRRAFRARDVATLRTAVATLRGCLDAIDANDVARYVLEQNYSVALLQRVGLEGVVSPADHDDLAAAARAAVAATDVPGNPKPDRVFMLGNAGIVLGAIAALRQDVTGMADAIRYTRQALDLADPDDANRPRLLAALGFAYCCRYEVVPAPRRADIDAGVQVLEEALRLAGRPGHHIWATTAQALARAYRLRNDRPPADRDAGRALALRSLRGHAWHVLLQSGTGRTAQEAATSSVEAALDAAGYAVADNEPIDAVRALDACRGLVLHAATVGAGMGEQLEAAGQVDLAREWRQFGGHTAADPAATVPSDLSYRVLTALTEGDEQRAGVGASALLLDTPREQDIRTALARGGTDALVYLVPANESCPGCAVVVPRRGAAAIVALPRLSLRAGVLQEFLATRGSHHGSGRDLKPAGLPDLAGGLGRLCDWTWYAAMDEILRRFRRPGRTPRLALVPMGPLGLVPWHAARLHRPGGGYHYALQEAVITYAPSARLLCDVLGRSEVPRTGASLVIGDPTGDLAHAGEEAAAIHDAFLPGGTFMGRRPDGRVVPAATPAETLGWLDAHDTTGIDMLHLACHAQVRPASDESAVLSLAGGDLGAERIVRDAGSRQIQTAILAACTTHISGRGFDEAFTLASAFLVAGARSVIGSLWQVPDDATSLLMFVLHEQLRAGLSPAMALRAAQRWMLDPRRAPTASMPRSMSGRVGHVSGDDLASWAGFIHLGR